MDVVIVVLVAVVLDVVVSEIVDNFFVDIEVVEGADVRTDV